MEDNFIIEQLKEFSQTDRQTIGQLASLLGHSNRDFTDDDLKEMLNSVNVNLLVTRDASTHNIVAMITVCVYRIPYIKKSYLDDFVVNEAYRGKGIGSKLFKEALELAKEKGAAYVDFTSNPKRLEGNKLYEKLGFKKRDTNVYRLVFE